MSSADVAWVLRSDCKAPLLELCLPLAEDRTWPALRAVGAGLWLPRGDALRAAIEAAAKAEFSATRRPEACALLYLALGKKGALQALCRVVRDEKLGGFLSHDFQEPRWRSAAKKNAFSLLSKQQHGAARRRRSLPSPRASR